MSAPGVPGRGEYLNENAPERPTSSMRSRVATKSLSVSPGKPTMKSEVSARSGPRITQPFNDAEIVRTGVTTVHCRQDAVGPRLDRQMQLRHELVQIAMRRY